MKNYTFVENNAMQFFGKITIEAKNKKEARAKLLGKITENIHYGLLVLNHKTSELFTLI